MAGPGQSGFRRSGSVRTGVHNGHVMVSPGRLCGVCDHGCDHATIPDTNSRGRYLRPLLGPRRRQLLRLLMTPGDLPDLTPIERPTWMARGACRTAPKDWLFPLRGQDGAAGLEPPRPSAPAAWSDLSASTTRWRSLALVGIWGGTSAFDPASHYPVGRTGVVLRAEGTKHPAQKLGPLAVALAVSHQAKPSISRSHRSGASPRSRRHRRYNEPRFGSGRLGGNGGQVLGDVGAGVGGSLVAVHGHALGPYSRIFASPRSSTRAVWPPGGFVLPPLRRWSPPHTTDSGQWSGWPTPSASTDRARNRRPRPSGPPEGTYRPVISSLVALKIGGPKCGVYSPLQHSSCSSSPSLPRPDLLGLSSVPPGRYGYPRGSSRSLPIRCSVAN